MATGKRYDPYGNFNFLLEINNVSYASFSDCSGLGSSTEVIEHPEGGNPTKKLAGRTKYNNIVLKRGLFDPTNDDLYSWHQSVLNGTVERRDVSIVVLNLQGIEAVVRWNLYEAWPIKWDGPELSAKGNEVAIESLELACERIERG